MQIGDWYSTTLRPHDVSPNGIRLAIPGGAIEGARYRVVLRHADMELALIAEVRWVNSASEGGSTVGMSWVHTEGTSDESRREFFDRVTGA